MMRKNFLLSGLVLATMLLAPHGISAQPNLLKQKELQTITINGKTLPRVKALKKIDGNAESTSPRITAKDWSGQVQKDELINEDFSKFTAGSADKPDQTSICDIYGKYGPQREEIPSQYTQEPGWHGNWIFQAGGNAGLIDSLGSVGAFINSPLGDYSGDLTITIRAKGIDNSPSSFLVSVVKGGYYDPYTLAGWNLRLDKKNGWQIIELKYHNTVADNDGFIQINTYGKCLVDYVYVTNTYNFLAAPKVLEPTKFTDDGFTANWQPVRRASSYDLWIYKRVATSDKDSVFNENFENGSPAGWELGGKAYVAEGIGKDNSKAAVLNNADTISAPFTLGRYRNFSAWLKINANGATSDELNNGRIEIWLKTIDTWKKLGEMNAAGYTNGSIMDMQQKTSNSFANQFFGVRIIANLPSKATLVVDDAKATISPSAKLEPVGIYEEAGMRYANTEETSYTFTDLDPTGEYYYGVKSYYYGNTSTMSLNYAFGIGKPTVDVATNINSDGFTANWKESPKATSYKVNNYGIYTASKQELYKVISDDFSKINENTTISSNPLKPEGLSNNYLMSLDKYTKNVGWRGRYTALSAEYIGFTGSGELRTPALDLSNDDKFYIKLKAFGTPGDILKIMNGEQMYNIDIVSDPADKTGARGIAEGTFTVPDSGKNIELKFYSEAGATIMFDEITIGQYLDEGEKVSILLSSDQKAKGELSHTYTDLSKSGFSEFAYQVYANCEGEDGRTAVSDPSDFVKVNLKNGETNIQPANATITGIEDEKYESEAKVVGYYSIDGKKLDAPSKGLNIVRYSDGSAKKVIINK